MNDYHDYMQVFIIVLLFAIPVFLGMVTDKGRRR